MITDNVKKALKEYKQVTDNMVRDAQAILVREEIYQLQGKIDTLQEKLNGIEKPYKTKLDDTRKYIEIQTLEIATSFEHAGVKVSYRKGYERVTWTRKVMDDLCLKNPALLDLLAPARKITPVDPSVSIAIMEVDKE